MPVCARPAMRATRCLALVLLLTVAAAASTDADGAAAAPAAAVARGCRPRRLSLGVELTVASSGAAPCTSKDAGSLLAAMNNMARALPGSGPGSSTARLAGCAAAPGGAAYAFALTLSACAGTAAERLARAPSLSCAELAWPGLRGAQRQACRALPGGANVTAARRLPRTPDPVAGERRARGRQAPAAGEARAPRRAARGLTPRRAVPRRAAELPASLDASLELSWAQLVTGAAVSLSELLPVSARGAHAATAWLLSGIGVNETDGVFDCTVSTTAGVSISVLTVDLLAGLRPVSVALLLTYATGVQSRVNLALSPPAQQGWAAPVQFVGTTFVVDRGTRTAQLAGAQMLANATGLTPLITAATAPRLGAITLAPGGAATTASYTFTADPAQLLAQNKSTVVDQAYVTLLVLPGELDAGALHRVHPDVRAQLQHTVAVAMSFQLPLPLGTRPAAPSEDGAAPRRAAPAARAALRPSRAASPRSLPPREARPLPALCRRGARARADPCRTSGGGGIADPPRAAYGAAFYAHYAAGRLVIMASDSVTLTSDLARRDTAYYVPPCLNLEVYADTIIIDQDLKITGPRTVRLFARTIACAGTMQCRVDTRGYNGKSWPKAMRAADGADGLQPGHPDNKQLTEWVDRLGNGQDGSDGGTGSNGVPANGGGAGGDVEVFAADLGLQTGGSAWNGGVLAPVAYSLRGGNGGDGQIAGNGGKGGDATTYHYDECTKRWCALRKAFSSDGSVIQTGVSSDVWSGITIDHEVGRGCHSGIAGRGGNGGTNGENGDGGDGGVLSVATAVPEAIARTLDAVKPRGATWEATLANVLGSRGLGQVVRTGGAGGLTGTVAAGGAPGGIMDSIAKAPGGCWVREGNWAYRMYSETSTSFRCGTVGSMHDPLYEWKPSVSHQGTYKNGDMTCGTYATRSGQAGRDAPEGKEGATRAFDAAGVSRAPTCDAAQLELTGAGCPLLPPAVAERFRGAASTDQLGMMLTQGLIAFQTNDYDRAGNLTKARAWGRARRRACARAPRRGGSHAHACGAYMCVELLPRLQKLEASFDKFYNTESARADRERALEATLDNYEGALVAFKGERAQLARDIDSTRRTIRDLGAQRAAAYAVLQARRGGAAARGGVLRSAVRRARRRAQRPACCAACVCVRMPVPVCEQGAQAEFQAAIVKMEEAKLAFNFGKVVSVIGSAVAVTAEIAMTIAALKTGFGGGLMGGSSLIMMASPGGGIAATMAQLFPSNAETVSPLDDLTKVAVGSEEWEKAEGYKVQAKAKEQEESTTRAALQKAKADLAQAQADPDAINSPSVLASVREAYSSVQARAGRRGLQSWPCRRPARRAARPGRARARRPRCGCRAGPRAAQKRTLDMLYQQTLALNYLSLNDLKYTPPLRLDYDSVYEANRRLNDAIFQRMVPGMVDAIRGGQRFSIYLPASSLSGVKAQVVAERVEAVLLGARAKISGAVSTVRLVHTGHAEFLDVEGRAHTFRHTAFDAVSSKVNVATGRAEATTGNLRSRNAGAFSGDCQQLTIPDDNNMLLPVSPFTIWLADVPPTANADVDLDGVWGLRLRFIVRYRTSNVRAATASSGGAAPRRRPHDGVWGRAFSYS
ncbi:hypothetical protein HT031_003371 [Scenedesmus sp. PABB004]|nr:hypothetical protein HT031_003371 [Scenedesmus sp. PABB004]